MPTLEQGAEHGRIVASSKLALFAGVRRFGRDKPAPVINSRFSLFMVGITLKASMKKVDQTARMVSRTVCHWEGSKDGPDAGEIFENDIVR
jgi:hypothetical protein